jgi:aconitase A
MLGRASMMRLPEIVGVKLAGKRAAGHHGDGHRAGAHGIPAQAERVVGAWVEFFGEGAAQPDHRRPRDHLEHVPGVWSHGGACSTSTSRRIDYLKLTGREPEQIALVENYAKTTGLWADALKAAELRARAASSTCRASCATWPARPTRISRLPTSAT